MGLTGYGLDAGAYCQIQFVYKANKEIKQNLIQIRNIESRIEIKHVDIYVLCLVCVSLSRLTIKRSKKYIEVKTERVTQNCHKFGVGHGSCGFYI